MFRIRKNDTVKVLSGKDKGKTGKVIGVYPRTQRALVQGINFVKKHARRKKQDDQSGIVTQESPISVSNLSVLCKRCNKTTRIGVDILQDGTKIRFCKKCKEVL